jgi:hypothetical protein
VGRAISSDPVTWNASKRFALGVGARWVFAFLLLTGLGCDLPEPVPRWRDVASELGLNYRVELTRDLRAELGRLPSVAAHPTNFFPEVMSGEGLVVADWVWRDGRERAAQTVFAFRRAYADGPDFVIARRGGLSPSEVLRLGGMIDWPEAPTFAQAFEVASGDPEAVRRLLTRPVRDALDLPANWRIEGAGSWVVVYAPGLRLPPTRLAEALSLARSVAAVILGS